MSKYSVLCYTRKPEDDAVYSEKLAKSMHLAIDMGTGHFEPLNHNAGILYVKATQNEDGTLNAMSLKNPWLFLQKDGSFGVIAQRILPSGEPDVTSRGKLLYFTSKDLLSYAEKALLDLPENDYVEDARCEYQIEAEKYSILWRNRTGACYETQVQDLASIHGSMPKRIVEDFELDVPETSIAGAVERNVIALTETVAKRLYRRLSVPVNTANIVPECVKVTTAGDLKRIKATAVYSDGSRVEKPVDWDVERIDFSKNGMYTITGRIHQEHFQFPVAINRADPCVGKWKGKYYFIATNDADNNHTLYIREADTLSGLVSASDVLLLDSQTYPHIGNLLWAPEFHIIKGKLYIFLAATPEPFMEEQAHVMMLKENGNPMNRLDWTAPRRVIQKDGTMLCGPQGITLDMTEFEVKGRFYVMWSQRQFQPVDLGAWLYIAEIHPDEPWKLISDPVLISMPEYGWANNHGFVDEGPFAIVTREHVFVTFSSASVDSTYVVGLLTASPEADLLRPESWTKCNYPLMSCRTKPGEFGTGHNAYIQDEDGLLWSIYHARPGIDAPRCTGIRRVHFDVEGYPVLEMTEDKDVNAEAAIVHMNVILGRKVEL